MGSDYRLLMQLASANISTSKKSSTVDGIIGLKTSLPCIEKKSSDDEDITSGLKTNLSCTSKESPTAASKSGLKTNVPCTFKKSPAADSNSGWKTNLSRSSKECSTVDIYRGVKAESTGSSKECSTVDIFRGVKTEPTGIKTKHTHCGELKGLRHALRSNIDVDNIMIDLEKFLFDSHFDHQIGNDILKRCEITLPAEEEEEVATKENLPVNKPLAIGMGTAGQQDDWDSTRRKSFHAKSAKDGMALPGNERKMPQSSYLPLPSRMIDWKPKLWMKQKKPPLGASISPTQQFEQYGPACPPQLSKPQFAITWPAGNKSSPVKPRQSHSWNWPPLPESSKPRFGKDRFSPDSENKFTKSSWPKNRTDNELRSQQSENYLKLKHLSSRSPLPKRAGLKNLPTNKMSSEQHEPFSMKTRLLPGSQSPKPSCSKTRPVNESNSKRQSFLKEGKSASPVRHCRHGKVVRSSPKELRRHISPKHYSSSCKCSKHPVKGKGRKKSCRYYTDSESQLSSSGQSYSSVPVRPQKAAPQKSKHCYQTSDYSDTDSVRTEYHDQKAYKRHDSSDSVCSQHHEQKAYKKHCRTYEGAARHSEPTSDCDPKYSEYHEQKPHKRQHHTDERAASPFGPTSDCDSMRSERREQKVYKRHRRNDEGATRHFEPTSDCDSIRSERHKQKPHKRHRRTKDSARHFEPTSDCDSIRSERHKQKPHKRHHRTKDSARHFEPASDGDSRRSERHEQKPRKRHRRADKDAARRIESSFSDELEDLKIMMKVRRHHNSSHLYGAPKSQPRNKLWRNPTSQGRKHASRTKSECIKAHQQTFNEVHYKRFIESSLLKSIIGQFQNDVRTGLKKRSRISSDSG